VRGVHAGGCTRERRESCGQAVVQSKPGSEWETRGGTEGFGAGETLFSRTVTLLRQLPRWISYRYWTTSPGTAGRPGSI
jgi:hypothetical protein